MIVIDPAIVRELAMCQATQAEAAAYLNITHARFQYLLRSNMSVRHAWYRGKEAGKVALRMSQFNNARAGDNKLLTFLGKNYLGQKDKVEAEVSGKDGKPAIQVTFVGSGNGDD